MINSRLCCSLKLVVNYEREIFNIIFNFIHRFGFNYQQIFLKFIMQIMKR